MNQVKLICLAHYMSQWALQALITTPPDLNHHGDKEKHWQEKNGRNLRRAIQKDPQTRTARSAVGAERGS